MNKDYNKLLNNIDITEAKKQELYENCIRSKHAGDFLFRYSQPLCILIAAAVFMLTGIGATAAVLSVKDRMESMSEEEYNDYAYEVENDTFVSVDEGFSRELRDSEILRIIELERDYYDNGVFPVNTVPHLQTAAEREEDQLAYVAEDNLLYLPEKDMDDEQILEYIDHDAKKWYLNSQALMEEGFDVGTSPDLTYDSTEIAEGSGEQKARDAGEKLLKDIYGVDINADKNWIVLVEFFEGEEGITEDLYQLDIYKKGTGYADSYQLRLRAEDMSPILINLAGYERELRAKRFSTDEADAMNDSAYESAVSFAGEYLGLGTPEDYRFEEDFGATADGEAFKYLILKYGDKSVYFGIKLEDMKVIMCHVMRSGT